MTARIPALGSLGFLALTATACSDADKVAAAYKAVCKARCDCPDSGFDDPANCKKACRGEAKIIEAELLDSDSEPCAELDEIIADFKACAKKSCDEIDSCLYGESYDDYYDSPAARFYECWPFYEYEYGNQLAPETLDEIQSSLDALPRAIPRPILRGALHAAACSEAEAESEHE